MKCSESRLADCTKKIKSFVACHTAEIEVNVDMVIHLYLTNNSAYLSCGLRMSETFTVFSYNNYYYKYDY